MNRKLAASILETQGKVILRCNGNSMQPIMSPGDSLHIMKVNHESLQVGDAVFCLINKNFQVHKISAISDKGFQISNNRGYVNGTIKASNIYGLCVAVNDRAIVPQSRIPVHVD